MTQPTDNQATPRRRARGRWAGLLGVCLLVSLLPVGPQHAVVREMLKFALGRLTGREVAVARSRRVLWRGIRLEGLRVAGPAGLAAGDDLLAVERLDLDWSLWRALRHWREPLRGLRRVTVVRPVVRVKRLADGAWELLRLFPPRPRPPTGRPLALAAPIELRDGQLLLTDASGQFDPRTLTLERARARFDGRGSADLEVALGAPGLLRRLALTRGRLSLDPFSLTGDLAGEEIALTTAAPLLNPFLQQWAELRGGTVASVAGPFSVALPATGEKTAPRVTLDLTAELAGVTVATPRLAAPVGLTGGVQVALATGETGPRERLGFAGLTARLGENRLRLDGEVLDFRAGPRLHLTVTGEPVRVGSLAALAPGEKILRRLRGEGESRFSVRLAGALDALRVVGRIEPRGVGWADEALVRAGRLNFDLRRVAAGGVAGLRGGVELVGVALTSRYLAGELTRLNGRVTLGDDAVALANVAVLAGGAPLRVGGTVERLTGRGGPRLGLEVAVEGLAPTLAAPALPAGWRPTASRGGVTGRVKLTGPLRLLAVSGRVRAPYVRLPRLTHLGGDYTFDLRLGPRPTGRLTLADAGVVLPAVGEAFDRIHGGLVLEPTRLRLLDLRLRHAGGTVRVEGEVGRRGETFALAVLARELELARLTRLTARQGVTGRGPLTADLRLTGSRRDLRVAGRATVPWLRAPGATIRQARATADLRLRPAAGLVGLTGELELSRTAVRPDAVAATVEIDRGRFRFDRGRINLSGVRGRLNDDAFTAAGLVRLTGSRRLRLAELDLRVATTGLREATLRKLAPEVEAVERVRLLAPVTADLRVSGAPDRLRLRGTAATANLALAGEPRRYSGRAELDLTLPAGGWPTGRVDLADATLRLSPEGPAQGHLTGRLTFAPGRLILVGEPTVAGRLGDSPLRVGGRVALEATPRLDLTVELPRLALADVQTALTQFPEAPEIEGDGDLGEIRLRLLGPVDALRVATVGPAGELGGLVELPARLAALGHVLEGGRAGLDLTLGQNRLQAGRVQLAETVATVGGPGTRIAVAEGYVELADGQLHRTDVRGTVGGAPVRVAGGSRGAGELALRAATTEVPLGELLPSLAKTDALAEGLVSADVTVIGPPGDLALAGGVVVGGQPGVEPLRADVHLRLVDSTLAENGERRPPELLGGVLIHAGGLVLPSLAEPLTGLRGQLTFLGQDLLIDDLQGELAGSRVALQGGLYDLRAPVAELTVDLPAADLGRFLAAVRLPPDNEPAGEPVDFFTARRLPRVTTPEPARGRLTVTGPLGQVTVGVDLSVPLLCLAPEDAMPDDRGLASRPEGRAAGQVILLRDARVGGSAMGSLGAVAEALPTPDELAAAAGRLAGYHLVAATPAPPPPPAPEFHLALTCASEAINPRQAFAFLSDEARAGELASAYAYAPAAGRLEVLGPLAKPQLRGGFVAPRVTLRGLPVRRLAADFDFFDGLMTLTNLEVDIRGGKITGAGALTLIADQPVDMQLDLDVTDLELAAANTLDLDREQPLDVDGLLNGRVQFHLSEDTLRLATVARATHLAVAGERLGDAEIDVGLVRQQVRLRRFDLRDETSGARVKAKGNLDLSDDGRLDLACDIHALDLGRLAPLFGSAERPPLSGRLNLLGHLTGTRRSPLLAGQANLFFGSVAGYPFHRLTLLAEPGPAGQRVAVDLSDAAWRVTGDLTLANLDLVRRELDYDVRLNVAGVDLAQALPLVTAGRVTDSYGQLTGEVDLAGKVRRVVTAEGVEKINPLVDLTGVVDLSAGSESRPEQLRVAGRPLDRARLELWADGDQVEVKQLEVVMGSTRLGIDPEAPPSRISDLDREPTLDLRIATDQLDYDDLVELTGVAVPTEGGLALEAAVLGPLDDPVTELAIRTRDFKIAGGVVGTREIKAKLARKILILDGRQEFDLFGARLGLAGYLDGEALQSNVDLTVTDFEQLRTFLRSLTVPVGQRRLQGWQISLRQAVDAVPEPLTGRLEARLRLTGTTDRPRGFLDAETAGLRADGRPLPDVEVDVNIGTPQPRRPESQQPGVIHLFGAVQRAAEATALRLQLACDRLELAPFAPWSPKLGGLRGRLSVAATATGTSAEPRVELLRLDLTDFGARDLYLAEFGIRSLIWQPGTLELGRIGLNDGQLAAQIEGRLPLKGSSLALRPDGPVHLEAALQAGSLADLADMAGSLGHVAGRAALELVVDGTLNDARTNGLALVDLPYLEVIDRGETAFTPAHRPRPPELFAPLPPDLSDDAPTPFAAPPPLPAGVTELLRVADGRVRLQLTDNVLRVDRFYLGVEPPGGGGALTRRGEVEVVSGGTIELPRPFNLLAFVQQPALVNPIDLKLRARRFSGRTGLIRFDDVDLAVDVEPVFRDGVLNRVVVQPSRGWLNGGLLEASGRIDLRRGELGSWTDQWYDLRLASPPVPPGAVPVGVAASPPVAVEGGVVYPLTISDRRAGQARAAVDLTLATREGQTPPLTLGGRVELFDSEIREGGLALFAARPGGGEPAQLTGAVALDLLLDATRNNWLRTKVPELIVPVRGSVRVSETPQRLRLDGTAEVGEGQLDSSLLKSRVAIRGGQARFTVRRNPLTGEFQPFASFTARAETQLSQPTGGGDRIRYDVNLELRGSARPGTTKPVDTEFIVRADSNPPLAEEQIFAMLSRKAEFAAALEEGTVQTFLRAELANAAVQTALSYALTPVFDELRRAFGLDVFVIRYELDRPLEIQASKYLLKRLFVTVFVEVGGTSGTKQTVKVDYELANGIRFGIQTDTDNDFRMTGEWSGRY